MVYARQKINNLAANALKLLYYVYLKKSACEAIREMGPTIQTIDFRIMRDSISF